MLPSLKGCCVFVCFPKRQVYFILSGFMLLWQVSFGSSLRVWFLPMLLFLLLAQIFLSSQPDTQDAPGGVWTSSGRWRTPGDLCEAGPGHLLVPTALCQAWPWLLSPAVGGGPLLRSFRPLRPLGQPTLGSGSGALLLPGSWPHAGVRVLARCVCSRDAALLCLCPGPLTCSVALYEERPRPLPVTLRWWHDHKPRPVHWLHSPVGAFRRKEVLSVAGFISLLAKQLSFAAPTSGSPGAGFSWWLSCYLRVTFLCFLSRLPVFIFCSGWGGAF